MNTIDQLIEQAKVLGFTAGAAKAELDRDRARRMYAAYTGYEIVEPGHIEAFQERLKARSMKRTGEVGVNLREHFDTLVFEAPETYKGTGDSSGLPPKEALDAFAAAKDAGMFDTFEVARVESVQVYKDPILFGRIDGCLDRFFIAQWGDDVSLKDLIG